jgi:hypothetical protein
MDADDILGPPIPELGGNPESGVPETEGGEVEGNA